LRVGLSFISGIIIARTLGPSNYGNFNFLLGSFTALASLVDMASSSAFYTFISQKKRGLSFFFYYTVWISIQFSILLLIVLFLPVPLKEKIWLGHTRSLILFALFTSFSMNQIWNFWGQIGESIRDTIGVQVRNLVMAAAYLSSILVLGYLGLVNLKTLFLLNISLYLLFSALYGLKLFRTSPPFIDKKEDLKHVFKEFKGYCSPLILYSWVGFLYAFADYWLLQKFGGAAQQGYYAIGARFASISLIATSSMLQVFWKEISEAHDLGNMDRVRMLYNKVSRGLYFVGAFLSGLLIPFSKDILVLLLGPAYQDAWIALSLMFLYPVHQSMGQITGTMFLATEKTKAQSYIGLFFMAISIPVAYFVLAPKNLVIPGLNLGASGLALKMVFCQIVGVNLSAFFISKYIDTPFDWSYQINVLMLLVPMGFISKFLAGQIFSLWSFTPHTLIIMSVSALLYSLLIGLSIFRMPTLAGVTKEEIHHTLTYISKRLSFA
jgi:O-antigen/teichoic acid export membrane protein